MISTGPTFTVDGAAVLTQAAAIFNAFGGVLVLILGIALGITLLRDVKSLFG